jgi:hypothetical protein
MLINEWSLSTYLYGFPHINPTLIVSVEMDKALGRVGYVL